MRKNYNSLTLNILFLLLGILASCSDDKDSILDGNGLKENSWSSNKTYSIVAGQTLEFTFNAQSSWTAQSNSATLLTLNTNSGNSGKNTLKVTANKSSELQATITVKVNGYSSDSKINFKLSSGEAQDNEVNYAVDQYLKEKYLWNDEYKTLNPDFTLAYDKFLDNTLMSMSTNTLDKKRYINGNGTPYYSLFSFIQKLDPDLQSIRSTVEKKVLEYSYGFINLTSVRYSKDLDPKVFLAVQGVHPGSSADQAEIKRGVEITHINGQILTESNWYNNYINLLMPSSPNTLTVKDYNGKNYTINSGPISLNPVIRAQVNAIGTRTIGYLAYSAFQAGFDQELFDAFKDFHNKNATDLVLDFRYNGGGHVISANLIASCVAGQYCEGKTFASYRYNDERMKVLPDNDKIEKFSYSGYKNLNNISLSAGGLNLKHIYCLVSDNTASSSELVINSLRGIGIEVTLVGTTTRGKNVGMEGVVITTAAAKYELYPITFQSYNANGFGEYEKGFTPEFIIDENSPNGLNFDGYGEFGTTADPLYAKAVSLITGTNTFKSLTRSTNQPTGRALSTPEIKRIGMIK